MDGNSTYHQVGALFYLHQIKKKYYSLWHILLSFNKQLNQIPSEPAVGIVEEWSGYPEVTHPASTTDTVDVLLHVGRQVEVDHVTHVGDIQTLDAPQYIQIRLVYLKDLMNIWGTAMAAYAWE